MPGPPLPPQDGSGGGSGGPGALQVQPTSFNFGGVATGSVANIMVTVTNIGGLGFNVNTISIGGAPYSLIGLPSLPFLLAVGASFQFTLRFSPVAVGTFNDTLSITTDASVDNAPFSGAITGSGITTGVSVTPSPVSFPDTVITHPSAAIVVTIKNIQGAGNVTVNTIAMAAGTQFAISGIAPALPATIGPGATVTFNLTFTPLLLGTLNDTINITTTVNNPAVPAQGKGVQITPIAILNSSTRSLILSFLNTITALVQTFQLDSTNLNGLLTGNSPLVGTLLLNGPLWAQPGQEKALRRIWIAYENIGVASLTATVSVLRPQQGPNFFDVKTQTISIGTALADLTERTAFFDIQIAGEIIFLTLTRPASSGPISLIGFFPEFEAKGEKVEGV